jgi:hypothetical protein
MYDIHVFKITLILWSFTDQILQLLISLLSGLGLLSSTLGHTSTSYHGKRSIKRWLSITGYLFRSADT